MLFFRIVAFNELTPVYHFGLKYLLFFRIVVYCGFLYAGLAQLVEQLICNQQVGGSSPLPSFRKTGEMPERLKGAGCKPVGLCLRRFESYSLHHFF